MTPGFWRHRNFIDVDFYALSIYPGSIRTQMSGYWVLQRNHDFVIDHDKIFIYAKEYPNWWQVPYNPERRVPPLEEHTPGDRKAAPGPGIPSFPVL